MSKAKITYRFDPENRGGDSYSHKETGKNQGIVIPLYQNEAPLQNEGKEPPAKPGEVFSDPQMLNQFATDYGAWSSPFDMETQRLEKLIRESDALREENARRLKADRTNSSFSRNPAWDIPGPMNSETGYVQDWGRDRFGPEIVEDKVRTRYVKRSSVPWMKIITSVSGAVVTGLLFGLFVLSMFHPAGDRAADITSKDALNSAASGQTGETPAEKELSSASSPTAGQKEAAGSAAVGMLQADIPAQTYYMLQNGVFSGLEGAQNAQEELRKKGLAAVSESSGPFVVYAGMTRDRNDALALSRMLQDNNLEVYIKAYEIPGTHQLRWAGTDAQTVESYFSQAQKLIGMIGDLSLLHLEESNPTAIDTVNLDNLKSAHQSWTDTVKSLSSSVSESVRADFDQLSNAMNTAVISMEEYNKNPSKAHLWQAQTSIMEFAVTEKRMLKELSGQQ
ncbi:SPOR domain-containing protein [Ferviditalea candida]|uniref:SPOR domain-containing protein n=1 Tax=Ferviditalea candida TaxID=3108399 RepID=A0ABU5ZDU4_9BACL|nr:SPOR domain-containing protein [Paenibacillaceae bacterium T2]